MKILQQEDISKWNQLCNCYRCNSKLQAEGDDLYFKRVKKSGSDPRDPSDHYEYLADTYYVICPVCKNEIAIDSIKIPYLLRSKAETRGK